MLFFLPWIRFKYLPKNVHPWIHIGVILDTALFRGAGGILRKKDSDRSSKPTHDVIEDKRHQLEENSKKSYFLGYFLFRHLTFYFRFETNVRFLFIYNLKFIRRWNSDLYKTLRICCKVFAGSLKRTTLWATALEEAFCKMDKWGRRLLNSCKQNLTRFDSSWLRS